METIEFAVCNYFTCWHFHYALLLQPPFHSSRSTHSAFPPTLIISFPFSTISPVRFHSSLVSLLCVSVVSRFSFQFRTSSHLSHNSDSTHILPYVVSVTSPLGTQFGKMCLLRSGLWDREHRHNISSSILFTFILCVFWHATKSPRCLLQSKRS